MSISKRYPISILPERAASTLIFTSSALVLVVERSSRERGTGKGSGVVTVVGLVVVVADGLLVHHNV